MGRRPRCTKLHTDDQRADVLDALADTSAVVCADVDAGADLDARANASADDARANASADTCADVDARADTCADVAAHRDASAYDGCAYGYTHCRGRQHY